MDASDPQDSRGTGLAQDGYGVIMRMFESGVRGATSEGGLNAVMDLSDKWGMVGGWW